MSPRELLPLADSLAIFLVEHRSQIPIRLVFSDFSLPLTSCFLWFFTSPHEFSRPGVSYHAVREANRWDRKRSESVGENWLGQVRGDRARVSLQGWLHAPSTAPWAVGLVTSEGVPRSSLACLAWVAVTGLEQTLNYQKRELAAQFFF